MSVTTLPSRFDSEDAAKAHGLETYPGEAFRMVKISRGKAPYWRVEPPQRKVSATAVIDAILEASRGPKEDTRDKFNVIRSADFSKRPLPEYLIKGVLYRSEIAALVGAPGTGKSALAYSMAAAISRGSDWFGHRVSKGRAVYIIAEGAAGFVGRIDAYRRDTGAEHTDLPELIADVPNLKERADAELIAKQIGKADAIWIDTLAASFQGNENTSEDIGPVLANCKLLHERTGALVILLCHPGKTGTSIRGWSGTLGALDTEISIERTNEHRAVSITKQKDSFEGPLMGFTLKPIQIGLDTDGDAVTSIVVEETAAPIAAQNKPSTKYEIATMNAARMWPSATISIEELQAEVLASIPRTGNGKRDQRGVSFGEALKRLCEKGQLRVIPGTDEKQVELPIKVLTEEEFPG